MEHALQPLNTASYDITATAKLYLGESLSLNTRMAYRSDINIFLAWCRLHGCTAFPSSPSDLSNFISDQASGRLSSYSDGVLVDGEKIKPVTLARRIAAIAYAHKANGFSRSPTDNAIVRKVLQGIRRTERYKPNVRQPIIVQTLVDILGNIDETTLVGLRDRALLLIGFACAMRRSELVNLKVEDIEKTDKGLLIYIPHSKTDQTGRGESVAVIYGTLLCPIRALDTWIKESGIEEGYVFRRMYRNSVVDKKNKPMTDHYVSRIIKQHAGEAGFDTERLSGHSLRRGFVTASVQRGAHLLKVMSVTRHKNLDTLKKYADEVEKFDNHASEGLL